MKFFIESLEQWRKLNRLSNFSLFSNNFGAYVAAHYAREYPNVVDNLILLSPYGLQSSPLDLENQAFETIQSLSDKFNSSFIPPLSQYLLDHGNNPLSLPVSAFRNLKKHFRKNMLKRHTLFKDYTLLEP